MMAGKKKVEQKWLGIEGVKRKKQQPKTSP